MKKQLLLFAMILLPLVASAHDIEVQKTLKFRMPMVLPFITTTLMIARNWRLLSVVGVLILIQTNIKAMLLFLRK